MVQGRPHITRMRMAKPVDLFIFKHNLCPVVSQKVGRQRLKVAMRGEDYWIRLSTLKTQTKSHLPEYRFGIEIKAIGLNSKDLVTLLDQVKSDNLGRISWYRFVTSGLATVLLLFRIRISSQHIAVLTEKT